jgi:hypothetical protein
MSSARSYPRTEARTVSPAPALPFSRPATFGPWADRWPALGLLLRWMAGKWSIASPPPQFSSIDYLTSGPNGTFMGHWREPRGELHCDVQGLRSFADATHAKEVILRELHARRRTTSGRISAIRSK